MKVFGLIIIMLITLHSVHGQDADSLIYDFKRKLTWEDFQGKPNKNDTIHGAEILLNIWMKVKKVSFWTGRATFETYAVAYKSSSWVNPKYKDDFTLSHEQLHFDIAALYAKKLEKEINSLNLNMEQMERINEIFNKWNYEMRLQQELFDKETREDVNLHKIWQLKVFLGLKALGIQ